ncbi:hypothetical protein F4821DRAFT_265201 [Hypoxylon rubiginosum]|uniref:Uncharacterized protein n=1 Tax=Hypoxylon rubiginosum TaxID=110542 RepID=A0ACC0CL29_9PEZI|nr:hypothetical protein F4821DRAFT_265201 [Hypoxylon rubiginosum]
MSMLSKNTAKGMRSRRESIPPISDILERTTILPSSDARYSHVLNGEYEWLLSELSLHPVYKNLTLGPYEVEQRMYKAILDENIAKFNIRTPAPERIYQTPVYHEGKWICLPSDKDVDFSSYSRELSAQFYRDQDFFRAMVVSFWGPCVASVFPMIHQKRHNIQIAFDEHFEHHKWVKTYELHIVMFAYMMGRLRVIDHAEPMTKIFGFRFVDHTGDPISVFETRARLLRHNLVNDNERLIILHKRDPSKPIRIDLSAHN